MTAVRIIQTENGPVFPVCDLVENIGYSRSAATKALSRHKKMFNGLTCSQPIDTATRGIQQVKCLNEEGVRQFILLLTPSEEENPELCRRVELFKAQQLGKQAPPIPGIIPPVMGPDPLADALNRHADIADILIDRYDYPAETARKLAMAAVVQEVGDAAMIYKGPAMLTAPDEVLVKPAKCDPSSACFMDEADPDFEKYFSLRKVAQYTNLTEDRARNILEKTGLLHWANGIWHLTPIGQQFGKVFTTYPLAPHRMTPNKMIRWSPEAIERVKAYVSAGQSQLVESTSG